MNWANTHNIPESLASVLRWDTYQRRGDFSATELTKPARAVAIEREHESEIEKDVCDVVYSRLGTAWAAFAERKLRGANALAEEPLTAQIRVDGVEYTVSGRPDLYEEDGTITDWKTTSVYSFLLGSKDDWEKQLWVYAWLFRGNGFPVSGLRDVAILRDWSRGKAKGDPSYPQVPVFVQVVQSPPIELVHAYICTRIREHVRARAGQPPDCTPEERWHRPDRWAVMKEGRKSAVRVLDSEPSARDYMTGNKLNGQHSIVHRPGEDVRCQSYCDAAQWCAQLQATNIE